MTKKKAFIIALVGLSIALIYMAYGIVKNTNRKVEFTKLSLSKDYIHLFSIEDSTLFNFPKANRTILIYFNSGCGHCQNELNEIEKNKEKFEGIELIFFSMENIKDITAFVTQNKIYAQKNVYFTKINFNHQGEIFGSLPTPSFFLYKNKKLIKELKGERKVDEILSCFFMKQPSVSALPNTRFNLGVSIRF